METEQTQAFDLSTASAISVTTIEQPGIPTTVRDTVGAGDAFTAALVAGLLRNDPLATTAVAACNLAATVCAQAGAVPE